MDSQNTSAPFSRSRDFNASMNDDGFSMEEKLSMLQDRAKDIDAFLETLNGLKGKLEKKKQTIKDIIEKKIEDNQKELKKWRDLLFLIVDESLDEKIEKLNTQTSYYVGTKKDIEQVLENTKNLPPSSDDGDSDEESEDLKLDDLLEQDLLNLQPEGLTQFETTEMDSRVKNDFNVLLNEPKKSLRRTFAYVGGIIRGYLRRGKSNINWIKIMRKLEGREFEDRMLSESDPYVGAKINLVQELSAPTVAMKENVSNTWNSMTKLFENRNNQEIRDEFCEELYRYYEYNPEDVEFYLPQLCTLMLSQYHQFQPLKQFILEKCSQSIHFALQTYLLVRAAKDSREPPKKKKVIPDSIVRWRLLCDQLLSEITKAVRIPVNPVRSTVLAQLLGVEKSEKEEIKEITNEELFKVPIQFMDNLVAISMALPAVPSDQYATELVKRLEKENKFLQEEFARSGAFVYIPLLKPVGSAEYHRVIRIPAQEANPIPTYGRVLYYTLVEVIDAQPAEYLEYEKKPKKHKGDRPKKDKKAKKDRDHIERSGSDVVPHALQEALRESSSKEARDHSYNSQDEVEEPEEAILYNSGSISPKKTPEEFSTEKRPETPNHSSRREELQGDDERDLSHSSSSIPLEDVGEFKRPHKKNKDKHSDDSTEHKKHHKKKKEKEKEKAAEEGSEHSSPKETAPIQELRELSKSGYVTPAPITPSKSNGHAHAHHHHSHSHSHNHQQQQIVPATEQPLGYHPAFGELWEKKAKRIKNDSPYGGLDRWRMLPLIVKAGEEVLQEEFAMQLIVQFQRIFQETNVPVKVMTYRILAVSSKSGFIEPVPNSLSLDKLKKQHTNLLNFFVQAFGETSGPAFKQAQANFVKTMAAYSVVCYLLQIKDRHNGNILLDACGHLIHIDFGYLLGKSITFEKAPFKLTSEFVDVMGGYRSPCYKEYCRLCVRAFLAVRKHYKKIMLLVEMTMEGKGKKVLSCLQEGQKVLTDLLARFHLDWTDEQCEKFVLELIEEAWGSWRTIVYDAYQLILNNIH